MTRVDDLRAQYTTQAERAPEAMAMFFQGLLMGIDLASGAAAEDAKAEQREYYERMLSSAKSNGSGEGWKREAQPRGTRDPNAKVTVYALIDPRTSKPFYVGSAKDPQKQLADYTKSEDVSVSAKPTIDEIVGEGLAPTIQVLQTDVAQSEAPAAKERYKVQFEGEGVTLTNQRR